MGVYINNFKTEKSKHRYRFSIGIFYDLKFIIDTGISSNFGIGTSQKSNSSEYYLHARRIKVSLLKIELVFPPVPAITESL